MATDGIRSTESDGAIGCGASPVVPRVRSSVVKASLKPTKEHVKDRP